MFSFGRSSSSRFGTGSEISKSEKQKDDDDLQLSRKRSRSSLVSSKSKSKRKSSKRDDDNEDEPKRRNSKRDGDDELVDESDRKSSHHRHHRHHHHHDDEIPEEEDDGSYFSSKSRPVYTAEPSEISTYSDARSRANDYTDNSHALVRRSDSDTYRASEDRRASRTTRYKVVEYSGTRQRRSTIDEYTQNPERALALIPTKESENYLEEQDDRDKRRKSRTVSAAEDRRSTNGYKDEQRTSRRFDADTTTRKDSKRSSTYERRESSRTFDENNAALPANQFFSDPSTYTEPYRPPGLAADYYGDQGESVHHQPGVRPNQPTYVINQEQLHLQPPSADPRPPPEPSSTGQVGAAASFYANHSDAESHDGHASAQTLQQPGAQGPLKPSPRASPEPFAPLSNPLATAALGAGVGAATTYFTQDHSSPQNQHTSSFQSQSQSHTQSALPPQFQPQYGPSPQPPVSGPANGPGTGPANQSQPNSGGHNWGTAAAVGLAGAAAAGAYYNHHQYQDQTTNVSAHQYNNGTSNFAGPNQNQTQGNDPNFVLGQNQSAFPDLQNNAKRRRKGAFGRLAEWWQAPSDIAQFEEYTEYIGVCRDCFDPNSRPGEGPRLHHYHRKLRRQSSRQGSNLRVDKTYRHSSDEERYKSSSRAKKVAAAGLAGLGAAKIGEGIYNSMHDFDDTYSVKSGRPISQQRTSYGRPEDRQVDHTGRTTSNEDLRLRRKGSRSKVDNAEHMDRKTSLRRRGSRSSNEGLSRGGVMSVGVGAAGLAIAAEAAHRRRSRSRSNSRERTSSGRKYYSKRISPRHSYVDLSSTNTGGAGLGGFFSPSANSKKSKKSKGFFTLRNDSSSSSDADLAFGEGTVRRRSTLKDERRDERRRKDKKDGNDTAAILGLATVGTALAAESSRRADTGKDRRRADGRVVQFDSGPTSGPRINLEDRTADHEHDGEWEDIHDEEPMNNSNVDLALAYGGGLSAQQSRESLVSDSGTSKWDWRWNKKKAEREEKKLKRKQSMEAQKPFDQRTESQLNPFLGPSLAAAGLGGIAASIPQDPSPMTIPPMQNVDPMPIPHYAGGPRISPNRMDSFMSTPQNIASASQVELQQPQPMSSVQLENIAFQQPLTQEPEEIDLTRREIRSRDEFESKRVSTGRRRNSSPDMAPVNMSTLSRNSVSFRLTDEQLENERRAMEREDRKRKKRERGERQKDTDSDDVRRQSDEQKAIEKPSQGARRSSVDAQSVRTAEIDAELARLYAEHKQQQEEKRRAEEIELERVEGSRKEKGEQQSADAKRFQEQQSRQAEQKLRDSDNRRHKSDTSGMAAAAIVAGAGAVAVSALADHRREAPANRSEERGRRSEPVESKSPQIEEEISPQRETMQERIARRAAQRIRSRTPSPHEDYKTFFVPAELAEQLKEHNEAAERRDAAEANIIDISPDTILLRPKRKASFPDDLYKPFGLEPQHDPQRWPWQVPLLGLIEPTPPGSRAPSEYGANSPMVTARTPSESDEKESTYEPLDRRDSTSSKVKWGPDDTYTYDAVTPESEKSDPTEVEGRNRRTNGYNVQEDDAAPSSEPEAFYTGRNSVRASGDSGPEEYYRSSSRQSSTVAATPMTETYAAEPIESDSDLDSVSKMPGALPQTEEKPPHHRSRSTFEFSTRPTSSAVSEPPAKGVLARTTSLPSVAASEPQADRPKPWSVFDFQVQDDEEEVRSLPSAEPTPLEERDAHDLLGSTAVYQSPFAQTTSDIDLKSQGDSKTNLQSDLPRSAQSGESRKISTPPELSEAVMSPHEGGSRPSRSEARRAERAMSSTATEQPSWSTFNAPDDYRVDKDEPESPSTALVQSPHETPEPNSQLRNTMMSVAASAAAASAAKSGERSSERRKFQPAEISTRNPDYSSQNRSERGEDEPGYFNYDSRPSGDYSVGREEMENPVQGTGRRRPKSRSSKSEVGSASEGAIFAAAAGVASIALVTQHARRSEPDIKTLRQAASETGRVEPEFTRPGHKDASYSTPDVSHQIVDENRSQIDLGLVQSTTGARSTSYSETGIVPRTDHAPRRSVSDFRMARSDVGESPRSSARERKSSLKNARRSESGMSVVRSTHVDPPMITEPDSFYSTNNQIQKQQEEPLAIVQRTEIVPTAETDFYAAEAQTPERRKSKRGSDIFDDYDPSTSMTSLPDTQQESKSRHRSKRDAKREDDDDDTRSIASTTVLRDEDRRSRRKSERSRSDTIGEETPAVTEDKHSRRRSKHSSRDQDDDDDTQSIRSSETRNGHRSEEKLSRHNSRVAEDDDDTRSIRSSSHRSDKKSKDGKSNGFFSGMFSGSKADLSATSRKSSKSNKSEDRRRDNEDDEEESSSHRRHHHHKKHHSRSSEVIASSPDLSRIYQPDDSSRDRPRRGTEPDIASESRDRSTDDGFVSAQDEQSFLAERPDMPLPTVTKDVRMGTDGVSGLSTDKKEEKGTKGGMGIDQTRQVPGSRDLQAVVSDSSYTHAEAKSEDEREWNDAPTITDLLKNHPRALSVVQPGIEHLTEQDKAMDYRSGDDTATEAVDNATENRPRAQSVVQTARDAQDVSATPSPTSKRVPLFFKRLPVTPRTAQGPVSSPVAPAPSPLTTPKTRHGKTKSTEFSSREVRPLYLVQSNTPVKAEDFVPEDTLPSLPPSRATSIYGSTDNLPRLANFQEALSDGEADLEVTREKTDQRYSSQNSDQPRIAAQYLDSRSATPVPGDHQRLQEQQHIRERREIPKHLFHSPSELLQDPAFSEQVNEDDIAPKEDSPLPSVVSTVDDQEFMSAESRPETPILSQTPPSRSSSPFKHRTSGNIASRAAALFGGAAVGLAISGVGNKSRSNSRGSSISRSRTPIPDESQDSNAIQSQLPSISVTEPTSIDTVRTPRLHEFSPDRISQHEDSMERELGGNALILASTESPPKSPGMGPDSTSETPTMIDDSPASSSSTSQSPRSRPVAPLVGEDSSAEPKSASTTHKAVDDHVSERSVLRHAHIDPDDIETPETPLSREEVPHGTRWTDFDSLSDSPIIPRDEYFESTEPRAERTGSFAPTEEYDSLGAFELAFARAERVRGLGPGIRRDDAMAVFLPKRNNAPFMPKGKLTPILGSEQTSAAHSPVDSPKDRPDLGGPSSPRDPRADLGRAIHGKKASKKEKRKEKKLKESSRLSQEFTSEEATGENSRAAELAADHLNRNGTDNESIISVEKLDAALQAEVERRASIEPNDGDDQAVVNTTSLPKLRSESSSKSRSENREFELESHSNRDSVHDLASTDAAILQRSLADDESEPAVEEDTQGGSFFEPSGKKSKKDKKKKRKSTASDWVEEAVAPALIAAGASAATSAFSDNNRTDNASVSAEELAASKLVRDVESTHHGVSANLPSSHHDQTLTTSTSRDITAEPEGIMEQADPEGLIEDQKPWDFGLSDKQRKKKEKSMRKEGTWDSRVTLESLQNAKNVVIASEAEATQSSEPVLSAATDISAPSLDLMPDPAADMIADSEPLPAEDEWALPTSEDKKEKKKKRKSTSTTFEESLETEATTDVSNKALPSEEVGNPQLKEVFLSERSPLTFTAETYDDLPTAKIQTIRETKVDESTLISEGSHSRSALLELIEPAVKNQDDSTSVAGVVLDMLNRRRSSVGDLTRMESRDKISSEPLSKADTTQNMTVEDDIVPAVTQSMDDVPADADDDDCFKSSKKSKKDKKKKSSASTSFLALTETEDRPRDESSETTSFTQEPEPLTEAMHRDPSSEDSLKRDVHVERQELEAEERNSTVAGHAEASREKSDLFADKTETMPSDRDVDQSSTAVAADEEADQEAPSFSVKKSKKDKKKRKSQIWDVEDLIKPTTKDDFQSTTETTEPPMVAQSVEESTIATGSKTMASDDLMPTLTRKSSKNEKKKAKKSQWFDEPEQDISRSTEQDLAAEATEPEKESVQTDQRDEKDYTAKDKSLSNVPAKQPVNLARELHEEPQHQSYLKGVHEKAERFPSKPNEYLETRRRLSDAHGGQDLNKDAVAMAVETVWAAGLAEHKPLLKDEEQTAGRAGIDDKTHSHSSASPEMKLDTKLAEVEPSLVSKDDNLLHDDNVNKSFPVFAEIPSPQELPTPTLERAVNPFDKLSAPEEAATTQVLEEMPYPTTPGKKSKKKKRKSVIWADDSSVPGTPANESGLELWVPPSPERIYHDEHETDKSIQEDKNTLVDSSDAEAFYKSHRKERNVMALEDLDDKKSDKQVESLAPAIKEMSLKDELEGSDEWAMPSSSKKGKKKRKGSKTDKDAEVESSSSNAVTKELAQEPDPFDELATTSSEPKMTANFQDACAQELAETPNAEDDDWSATTSKKSKKDKKKKKRGSVLQLDEPDEASAPVTPSDKSISVRESFDDAERNTHDVPTAKPQDLHRENFLSTDKHSEAVSSTNLTKKDDESSNSRQLRDTKDVGDEEVAPDEDDPEDFYRSMPAVRSSFDAGTEQEAYDESVSKLSAVAAKAPQAADNEDDFESWYRTPSDKHQPIESMFGSVQTGPKDSGASISPTASNDQIDPRAVEAHDHQHATKGRTVSDAVPIEVASTHPLEEEAQLERPGEDDWSVPTKKSKKDKKKKRGSSVVVEDVFAEEASKLNVTNADDETATAHDQREISVIDESATSKAKSITDLASIHRDLKDISISASDIEATGPVLVPTLSEIQSGATKGTIDNYFSESPAMPIDESKTSETEEIDWFAPKKSKKDKRKKSKASKTLESFEEPEILEETAKSTVGDQSALSKGIVDSKNEDLAIPELEQVGDNENLDELLNWIDGDNKVHDKPPSDFSADRGAPAEPETSLEATKEVSKETTAEFPSTAEDIVSKGGEDPVEDDFWSTQSSSKKSKKDKKKRQSFAAKFAEPEVEVNPESQLSPTNESVQTKADIDANTSTERKVAVSISAPVSRNLDDNDEFFDSSEPTRLDTPQPDLDSQQGSFEIVKGSQRGLKGSSKVAVHKSQDLSVIEDQQDNFAVVQEVLKPIHSSQDANVDAQSKTTPKTREPLSEEVQTPAEIDEWALPGKKSKKETKKKKTQSTFEDFLSMDQERSLNENQESNVTLKEEASKDSAVQDTVLDQLVPISESSKAKSSHEAEEDEWAISSNSTKKKGKKKKSQSGFEEPSSGAVTPAVEISEALFSEPAEIETNTGANTISGPNPEAEITERALDDPVQAEAEDDWFASSKKSKKDKKKKRKSIIEDEATLEPESKAIAPTNETDVATVSVHQDDKQVDLAAGTDVIHEKLFAISEDSTLTGRASKLGHDGSDNASDNIAANETQQSAPPEDDEWAFKSKSKKKKRKSVVEEDLPDEQEQQAPTAMRTSAEELQEVAHPPFSAARDLSDLNTLGHETITESATTGGDVVQKDQAHGQTTTESALERQISVVDTTEPQQTEDASEEWLISSKKSSKKDKKKNKGSRASESMFTEDTNAPLQINEMTDEPSEITWDISSTPVAEHEAVKDIKTDDKIAASEPFGKSGKSPIETDQEEFTDAIAGEVAQQEGLEDSKHDFEFERILSTAHLQSAQLDELHVANVSTGNFDVAEIPAKEFSSIDHGKKDEDGRNASSEDVKSSTRAVGEFRDDNAEVETPQVEAEDDLWGFTPKEGKKDKKKKRKDTIDFTEVESTQDAPAFVPDIETAASSEKDIQDETAPAPRENAAREITEPFGEPEVEQDGGGGFFTSAKKSKKDKKKKKSFAWDDEADNAEEGKAAGTIATFEHAPVTDTVAPEETETSNITRDVETVDQPHQVLNKRDSESASHYTESSKDELEMSAPDEPLSTKSTAGASHKQPDDDLTTVDGLSAVTDSNELARDTDQVVEEGSKQDEEADEWAMPVKKSKKDKKKDKKRQSTVEAPNFDKEPVTVTDSQPTGEASKANESTVIKEAVRTEELTTFGDVTHSDNVEDRSRSPDLTSQGPSRANSQPGEDRAISAKKSKKDKKKKKSLSTAEYQDFDAPPSDKSRELVADIEIAKVVLAEDHEAKELHEDDKKEEPSATAVDEVMNRDREQSLPATPLGEEDEWLASSKKSKKDKKKKRGSTFTFDEPEPEQEQKQDTSSIPTESTREAAESGHAFEGDAKNDKPLIQSSELEDCYRYADHMGHADSRSASVSAQKRSLIGSADLPEEAIVNNLEPSEYVGDQQMNDKIESASPRPSLQPPHDAQSVSRRSSNHGYHDRSSSSTQEQSHKKSINLAGVAAASLATAIGAGALFGRDEKVQDNIEQINPGESENDYDARAEHITEAVNASAMTREVSKTSRPLPSAHELYNEPDHQQYLAGVHAKTAMFPPKPEMKHDSYASRRHSDREDDQVMMGSRDNAQRERSHSHADAQERNISDSAMLDEPMPEAAKDAEDDEWAFTTKKSKKDKKKRKSTVATEESMPAVEIKSEPTASREVPESIDRFRESAFEQQASESVDTPTEAMRAEDEGAVPAKKSKEKKKKGKISREMSTERASPRGSSYGEEQTVDQVVHDDIPKYRDAEKEETFEQPREVSVDVDESSKAEEEWAVPAKKTKKDKKKRKSTLTESWDEQSVSQDIIAENPAGILDDFASGTRDGSMVEAVEPEAPVISQQPTPVEDEWATSSKTSKKDKRKKSVPFFVESLEPTPMPSISFEDTAPLGSHDRAENLTEIHPSTRSLDDGHNNTGNDFSARSYRAHHDPEEHYRDNVVGRHESMTGRQSTRDIHMGTSRDVSREHSPFTASKITRQARGPSPEPESFYRTDTSPARTSRVTHEHFEAQPMEIAPSRSTELMSGSHRDLAEATSVATPIISTDAMEAVRHESRHTLREERSSHAHQREKSGTISTTVSHETRPHHEHCKSREVHGSSAREPTRAADDSDSGSQVSETTRERRRRKRSPVMWTGEEPDDLPRSPKDRALTPPPDHDDIMDTALVIAAGLGLGAAATESSSRSETTREVHRETRHESSGWSFGNLDRPKSSARDSGVQIQESPVVGHHTSTRDRDSGFMASPHLHHASRRSISERNDDSASLRVPRPRSPTSSTEDATDKGKRSEEHSRSVSAHGSSGHRDRSPLETVSHDRHMSSGQPSMLTPHVPHEFAHLRSASTGSQANRPNLRMVRDSNGNLRESTTSPTLLRSKRDSYGNLRAAVGSPLSARSHSPREGEELSANLLHRVQTAEVDRSSFSPSPRQSLERSFSPRSPLGTIDENSLALGAIAAGAGLAGGAALLARDRRSSLGGSKSRTSSFRQLRQSSASPSSSQQQQQPLSIATKSADGLPLERSASMAESFDGYGAVPGSPRSPARPPSLRKQQSLQQVRDLQERVDQLANDNRELIEQRELAERHIQDLQLEHTKADAATQDALQTVNEQLRLRDEEIVKLRGEIEKLIAARDLLRDEHDQRYTLLSNEKDTTHSRFQESTRELADLRAKHDELSSGMEGVVQTQIAAAIAGKDAELQHLREELEQARGKMRDLQAKILAMRADEVVMLRDEDYFENACQTLCQHVQQWVLRFSKFSDTRVCRRTDEVRDEKTVDRFDNSILDGSDVDAYLADRVKRRDVFMSVVMTMIWEYVFTRYLFGMDREQRQKLKQLEKNLAEVGPPGAVQQWRALTLTLLAKRQDFKDQKEKDVEAVANEILESLSKFLPPPQNLQEQIYESLRNVIRAAVKLAIEMRTQKAEYIMLPPLQPEYDTNGDLARKVFFNASLMNERSGETSNNDELEQNQAIVRMVLFPLVVKKGTDEGSGEEEIVVCPAQVLVAKPDKGKRGGKSRTSGGNEKDRERAQSRMSQAAMASTHSLGAMSGVEESNMI